MANAIRPIQNSLAPINNTELSLSSNIQAGDSTTAREMARIQGEIFMAKKYPRDTMKALDKIEQECARPTLASQAVYTYARGGSDIKGPSIRLAEAVARCWGNLRYGFEEISSDGKESVVRAYAYDVENNQQAERIFTVKLGRYSKRGGFSMADDPRDQYEIVANSASRRVRACILQLIPGDIIDYAVQLCSDTIAKSFKVNDETIDSLVNTFAGFGVTPAMLEKFVQRKLKAMTADQYTRLRSIYVSLRDGIAKVEDFFEVEKPEEKKEPEPALEEQQPIESYGPEAFDDDLTAGL